MFHELHESIPLFELLDETRSQESFELVHAIIGIPQQAIVQQSFVDRCFIF